MNAPWLVVANYMKGVAEFEGAFSNPKIDEMFKLSGSPWVHGDETPWCAAFVGACLRLSGFKSSNSLGARSYLNYGEALDEPRPGCIVVFWRGDPLDSSRGHVALFDHVDDTHIYVLGGNQGNQVQVSAYEKRRVLAFRLPTERAPMAQSKVLRNFAELTGTAEDGQVADAPVPMAPLPPVFVPPMPAPSSSSSDGDDEPIRMGVPDDTEGTMNGVRASNFGKVQPIVDKWEGGYVDHPQDPGGATNMGVTIKTLERWRGRAVSKADVKALKREEVWQIMKAFYYDVVRGDDLAIGVATAVHNAAVLSGPARSAKWLQQSMQALGANVTVDGAIGDQTIGHARKLNGSDLMEQFFRRQEAFYRGLENFDTFGKGWMNRLNDVRIFARNLQGAAESGVAAPVEETVESEAEIPSSNGPGDVILKQLGAVLKDPEIQKKLRETIPGSKGLLTPVNAALGQTIGNALNGNKTTIGAVGLLAGSLVNHMSPETAVTVQTLQHNVTPFLQPVALTSLLWGLLGKYEKWVYAERNAARPPR